VVAIEEALVDESAAEPCVVREEPPDRHVDLVLAVASAGLELDRDALQDDPSLGPLRRELGETPVPEERAEDRLLVLARGAERHAGLPRRSDLLGGPPERLGVEPVGLPIVVEADDAGRRQAVQVRPDALDRDPEALRQAGRAGGPPRERAGDRQALGVRERAQDLVWRLGHVGASP
jgi:hypothetical protein